MKLRKEKENKEENGPDAGFKTYYWGRHGWFRTVYHPLLLLTSKHYRFYRFSRLSPEKRKKKAEKMAKGFREMIDYPPVGPEDIIGREKEMKELLEAILYHVVRDKETINRYSKVPPPKIFLVKGSTGSGKTFMVQAVMREAFEKGIENGVIVNLKTVTVNEIKTVWQAMSAQQMAGMIDTVLSSPTILFFDEAQQYLKEDKMSVGNNQDYTDAKNVLLQKLDRLERTNMRGVVIFSTDEFEAIYSTARRRSRTIDLDQGIKEEYLVECARRMCKKYGITNLEPEAIVNVLGQSLRAVGQSSITFFDVTDAFRLVYHEKILNRKVKEAVLDDFADVAKRVKAYKEQEVPDVVRDAVQATLPTERYKDIGGLHGVKDEIISSITYCLNPELAKQVGYQPPRGFLFYGPPGTGKTLLAKAIAGESKAHFITLSGPEVFSKWVGESEKVMKSLFARAKIYSPSIIFIDEMESIAMERGRRSGDAGVSENVLAVLLKELDGFNPLGQVVFIGATNRKDMLDPAIIERLSEQYEFTYPKTSKEKKEIIEVNLNKPAELLSKEVTIDSVFKIFLKRTFSPRLVAQTISRAVANRGKEILACAELVRATEEKDSSKISQIKEDFSLAFERLDKVFGKESSEEAKIEKYRDIAKALKDPLYYTLTLRHIEEAFEQKVSNENLKETREWQRIYRSKEPEIGKAYGLATDALGQVGSISIVEAKTYPRSDRQERILVLGTVDDSIKDSAKAAAEFLREFCPIADKVDIDIHLISISEGVSEGQQKPSGPSAGMAITVALASALGRISLSPDVCMTGKVELLKAVAGAIGGIHPKSGSGKIDVAADEGFKKVIIPQLGYEYLKRDFPDYLEAVRERGTKVVGAKDFFGYMEAASSIKEEEIKERLKEVI
ncbi:MAG: AAA family ATPase [Candidatus Nealsonbacteria bacterium]|nr:AAA family ATPase [Candidatus Nealsonbacteria bacterium]